MRILLTIDSLPLINYSYYMLFAVEKVSSALVQQKRRTGRRKRRQQPGPESEGSAVRRSLSDTLRSAREKEAGRQVNSTCPERGPPSRRKSRRGAIATVRWTLSCEPSSGPTYRCGTSLPSAERGSAPLFPPIRGRSFLSFPVPSFPVLFPSFFLSSSHVICVTSAPLRVSFVRFYVGPQLLRIGLPYRRRRPSPRPR